MWSPNMFQGLQYSRVSQEGAPQRIFIHAGTSCQVSSSVIINQRVYGYYDQQFSMLPCELKKQQSEIYFPDYQDLKSSPSLGLQRQKEQEELSH